MRTDLVSAKTMPADQQQQASISASVHDFKLNITAAAFAPKSEAADLGEQILLARDLPCETVCIILSKCWQPETLASVACTCSFLRAQVKRADLRVRLTSTLSVQPTDGDVCPSPPHSLAIAAKLRSVLTCLTGITYLDVGDTVLEASHMEALMNTCLKLRCLTANSCRKLQSHAVASILGPVLHAKPSPPLAVLSLQRCFQLQGAALTQVLAASWAPGSRLACAALSHISLRDFLPSCGAPVVTAAGPLDAQPAGAMAPAAHPAPQPQRNHTGAVGALPEDDEAFTTAAAAAAAAAAALPVNGNLQRQVLSELQLELQAMYTAHAPSGAAAAPNPQGPADSSSGADAGPSPITPAPGITDSASVSTGIASVSTDIASVSTDIARMAQGDARAPSPGFAPSSSLRVLALHCCEHVDLAALAKIACAAPHLEMLLLGGSHVRGGSSPASPDCALPSAWSSAYAAVRSLALAITASEAGLSQQHLEDALAACPATRSPRRSPPGRRQATGSNTAGNAAGNPPANAAGNAAGSEAAKQTDTVLPAQGEWAAAAAAQRTPRPSCMGVPLPSCSTDALLADALPADARTGNPGSADAHTGGVRTDTRTAAVAAASSQCDIGSAWGASPPRASPLARLLTTLSAANARRSAPCPPPCTSPGSGTRTSTSPNEGSPGALNWEASAALGEMEKSAVHSAAALVTFAALVPSLRVLEVTHLAPGVSVLVHQLLSSPRLVPVLQAAVPDACAEAPRVQVWDMSSVAGVAAASAASAGDPLGVGVAVSAAVASSSAARHTPLHIAATDSSPALLCALLRLGPLVNARSKSGATPLFMACECGQADAVKKLLAAGADMWLATASDETCLYIAALRGHLRVVEMLLEHCQRQRRRWHDAASYGDRFTPLMSSVVAGHVSVTRRLLSAAGTNAAQLVASTNRFGQTAIHLAARSGSVLLLTLLLQASTRDVITQRDSAGRTPMDVAKKHSHSMAVEVLSLGVCAR